MLKILSKHWPRNTKTLLRRKFKDTDLLWLLDEIIDSAGLPIGNYLSQFLCKLLLNLFRSLDQRTKISKVLFQVCRWSGFILSDSKEYLHQLLKEIETYFKKRLKLTVKITGKYFQYQNEGIDFVGYKHYHSHVLLRKSIKNVLPNAQKTK